MHVESSAVVVVPESSLMVSKKVVAGLSGLRQPWNGFHRTKLLAGSSLEAVTVVSDPKSPPGDPVRDGREIPIKDGIGDMVTPAYVMDSPYHSYIRAAERLP